MYLQPTLYVCTMIMSTVTNIKNFFWRFNRCNFPRFTRRQDLIIFHHMNLEIYSSIKMVMRRWKKVEDFYQFNQCMASARFLSSVWCSIRLEKLHSPTLIRKDMLRNVGRDVFFKLRWPSRRFFKTQMIVDYSHTKNSFLSLVPKCTILVFPAF